MDTRKKTPGGWTNYATLVIQEFIIKREFNHWVKQAKEIESAENKNRRHRVLRLAVKIEDSFRDRMPTIEEPWRELILSSIDSVNWREIAETWIDRSS